jgi:AraC-like DNA-binding protein
MPPYAELAERLRKITFAVTFVGHKLFPPGHKVAAYDHPFFSIHYFVKGKAEYRMNGIHYTADEGRIAVFTPVTRFEWSTGTDCEFYHLRFDCRELYKEKQKWCGNPNEAPSFPLFGVYALHQPETVHTLFKQLYALYRKADAMSEFERQVLFQQLWLAIAKDFGEQEQSGDVEMSVQSTIKHIHDHFRETVQIRDLAEMAGLHPSHYCRKFKQLTGYNPKQYVMLCRINLAKEKMAYSDQSMKSIAHYVGYEDELYFSRVFKQITGLSPIRYSQLGSGRTEM